MQFDPLLVITEGTASMNRLVVYSLCVALVVASLAMALHLILGAY